MKNEKLCGLEDKMNWDVIAIILIGVLVFLFALALNIF